MPRPVQPVALSPELRRRALEELRSGRELDVLVIGGGVVGAGAALDAASRGLRVGVVELRDWASGTSSRSSKLIHGGLRYLEMLDFRLVHEALKERGLLLQRLAPHLVRPVPFLYPLKKHVIERPYAGAGVLLYDLMARTTGNGAGLPLHKHLTRRGAKKIAPGLKRSSLVGAIQYYDAKVDDARHTMMVMRTAASYGAYCANRTKVVDFLKDAGKVVGVKAVDRETGDRFEIRAKTVLNATGVWTDEIHELAETKGLFGVRMSKGIHLTVPKDRIDLDTGLILRTEKSVLFVIPWGEHWILGTTDTDWRLDRAHPSVSADNVQYVLDRVNAVLEKALTVGDVEGVYAGLRPLLAGDAEQTTKLSREHFVGEPEPNMFVIAGGKYTTYRVMGKDAIDAVAERLGVKRPSITHEAPLVGAEGYEQLRKSVGSLATEWNLPEADVVHLLERYGSLAKEVVLLMNGDPSLRRHLAASPYLRAEVVYAVSHEGAVHLEDVLTRRTRLYIESFDRATNAAEDAARLMAPMLGWNEAEIERQVNSFKERDAAEREAQTKPDDVTADEARLKATDIRPV